MHVLPCDFHGNHIPWSQERICGWYEVDYLSALKSKTWVGKYATLKISKISSGRYRQLEI